MTADAKMNRRSLARFIELVERALFELKLANDIAMSEKFSVSITSPLNGARRELNNCSRKFDEFKKASSSPEANE